MTVRSAPSSRVDLARLCALFVAVAEEGHFGAAADRLGTTQPTVSQGLQRLEAHLGVKLLDRNREGAVVTPAGRQLLPLARTLVRDGAHLESAAAGLASLGPSATLGVSTLIPSELASAAIMALRPEFDRVNIIRGEGPDLTGRVESGEIDVVLLEAPSPTGDLVRGVLHRLPRRLAVPRSVDRGSRTRIPWRELHGLAMAVTPRAVGPAAWDQLVDLVRESGIDPPILEVQTSSDALLHVVAGSGFAVVDHFTSRVAGVALLDLPNRFDLRVVVLVHPDRQVTPGGRDLRSTIDRGLSQANRAVEKENGW